MNKRPIPFSRGGSNRPPQKSVRAENLSRLAAELNFDLLSAALGVSVSSLQSLAKGGTQLSDEQCVMNIQHHLSLIGIPHNWLHQKDAPILPMYREKIIELAENSIDSEVLRVHNFKLLVQKFDGRIGVLADALDMTEDSILKLCRGSLVFDDQRAGHVNPRLMEAGFGNGWLERPQKQLTSDQISKLEQLASKQQNDEVVRPELTVMGNEALDVSRGTPDLIEALSNEGPDMSGVGEGSGQPSGTFIATLKIDPQIVSTDKAVRTDKMARLEQSKQRIAAVDSIMEKARRGAKKILWKDLLGKDLSFSGSLRRGTVIFHTELAKRVEHVLGLPSGWLDSPIYPPPSIASWITDPDAPLPDITVSSMPSEETPHPDLADGGESRALKNIESDGHEIPTGHSVKEEAASVPAGEIAIEGAKEDLEKIQQIEHIKNSVVEPKLTFTWTPAEQPVARLSPGPLVMAVNTILNKLAMDGVFTEEDAFRMISLLMNSKNPT